MATGVGSPVTSGEHGGLGGGLGEATGGREDTEHFQGVLLGSGGEKGREQEGEVRSRAGQCGWERRVQAGVVRLSHLLELLVTHGVGGRSWAQCWHLK